LECSHAGLLSRRLSSDEGNGTLIAKGGGNARDGRHAGDACQSRPRLSGMNRRLCVPYADDPDIFIDAAALDIHNMTTGEGK
jgi:hypothetical protein